MLLLAVRHKARSTSTIWTHVFSIFSGDGRWRVALAWDPTHHTHVHMLLLPHRRSSDAPSAATSYSGWYSGTVHGTVWYSVVHTGRPTTDLCCRSLAAAERGAATASPLWATDAYPRIYISTHLTYLRGPGTGTFQTKSPQFGSMTCQFTCQHRQNMDVDVDILFELRNLLILVASSQMSKTNEI